jgi:hypothetical protein
MVNVRVFRSGLLAATAGFCSIVAGICLIFTFPLQVSAQANPCADIHSVECHQKYAKAIQGALKNQFPNISVTAIEDVLVFHDPSLKDQVNRAAFHNSMESAIKPQLCQFGFSSVRIQSSPDTGENYGLGCERTKAPEISHGSSSGSAGAGTRATTEPFPPQKDDLAAAREATDNFLNGIKLIALPEGREILAETQWITGEADNGQNFYVRPQFTEATTLLEKLFDTDVLGVRGYKRFVDMKAVSKAGTPLQMRYFMIAFKDRHTGKWKVLGSGTEEAADVEHEIEYAAQHLHDTYTSSEQERYLDYGQWLLLAGHTQAAREALTSAVHAATVSTLGLRLSGQDKYARLHQAQIQALLAVIDAITAN